MGKRKDKYSIYSRHAQSVTYNVILYLDVWVSFSCLQASIPTAIMYIMTQEKGRYRIVAAL